ncbi:hypothetical protein [Sphingobium sp. HWE2-09]|uniref:hypothetical protein n=1 Tax=Sphingobium sp. HWE2-09 TaxID=3108390 RepID=UPI002DCA901B|nr:hypothetical protein [Sphingobium sp. HWE2-09]
MQSQLHHLTLFADYFQFYVCDAQFQTDTGTLWDAVATDRMLAVGPDLLAVGTARNMHVPVTLEMLDGEPVEDFAEWDQVIECGVAFPSGTIIAFGCTDNPDDAPRFSFSPGSYRARISYAGLDDLSDDGLDGNDRYRVQLWPGAMGPISVMKSRAL